MFIMFLTMQSNLIVGPPHALHISRCLRLFTQEWSRAVIHKQPSNSTLHVYSKGIICAHGTHCSQFLCACPSVIHSALRGEPGANTKGRRAKASERGTKSEVAHRWAEWLHNPCHLVGPSTLQGFTVGDKIHSGPQVGRWATNPCRLGRGPQGFRAGTRVLNSNLFY